VTEVWIVLVVAAAALAVAWPVLRRPGAEPAARAGPAEDSGSAGSPDDVAFWRERKARVLAALRELEADRRAGDISEEDYRALRRSYELEAAQVLQRLDALAGRSAADLAGAARSGSPAGAARGARRAARRPTAGVAWALGGLAFVAVLGLTLAQSLRPRGPDDTITGNDLGEGGGAAAEGAPLVPVDRARIAALEQRVARDSADRAALNELAHLYVATQRFREAADLSLRVLGADPENAEAMTHLGVVLWANGDPGTAAQALDHALRFDPQFAEAWLFKGLVAFAGLGDPGTAVEAWERYLALAPADASTERVRGMLEGARQAAARQREGP
jgi:tetratricopeptide (TPR) repeat protein